MASMLTACKLYHFKKKRCIHNGASSTIKSVGLSQVVKDVIQTFDEESINLNVLVFSDSDTTGDGTKLDSLQITFMDLETFGIKTLEISCNDQPIETPVTPVPAAAANAFSVLMSSQTRKTYVAEKVTSCGAKQGVLNAKDILYNSLAKQFRESECGFSYGEADTTGKYIVQVLTNVLWYVSNSHEIINSAAAKRHDLTAVPDIYTSYQNLNDVQRKKRAKITLEATQLKSHSQALYSILLKPIMNSSASWKMTHDNIKALADCLDQYSTYLGDQASIVAKNRALEHPVRTVEEYTTVEHRPGKPFFNQKYTMLNADIVAAELGEPIFFDEEKHCDSVLSNMQRHRFLDQLVLSVPVDMYRFCPGGSVVTVVCLVKVVSIRTASEMMTDSARVMSSPEIKSKFKEFHTRTQRKIFKERLSHVASVLPAVSDLIYKELALDATAADHPVTHDRVKLIFLGDQDLISDLRHLNPGRPGNKYDEFFSAMSEIVEQMTAADERRHNNIAHLSKWLSVKDLMQETLKKVPHALVPSETLVRLQFAPKNPYTKRALQFTSAIKVQYKVQRRQLRAEHVDQHYVAAQFKYLREKAIELKGNCLLFFCDDKSKVPIGEPGLPVSTGVRGKKTLAPSDITMAAMDHDNTKASLTPSVYLQCDIPDSIGETFLRGKVYTVVNDSVFQGSNPFRHAQTMLNLVRLNEEHRVPILFKFTDGGTDQRNNLQLVQLASICIFKELNLDMFITARCAPGQSWTNPAERIMSILNIGLQNCATERKRVDENNEAAIKKCGSMAEIREAVKKTPTIKEAWADSVKHVQDTFSGRFKRLALKEEPFTVLDPVKDEEIDNIKSRLGELFPEIDFTKTQKAHITKLKRFQEWKRMHTRERHYCFQIRKCEDETCCSPRQLDPEKLSWLPDPVLNDHGDHYLPFGVVKDKETEDGRPSQKQTSTSTKKTSNVQKRGTPGEDQASSQDQSQSTAGDEREPNQDTSKKSTITFSTQNARATAECVECRKPRVIYSNHKLTARQNMALAVALSEYDFTCGAPVVPENSILYNKVAVRPIPCAATMEITFYGASLGRKDTCGHCGQTGADPMTELQSKFKTVLPLCEDCKRTGKEPVTQRPFGKKTKN